MPVFTSYTFWLSLCLVQSGCVWIGLVVSPFSVATCREWWFCLGERAYAQNCVRTNALAQIAMVRAAIYVNQTMIVLKVDTYICDTCVTSGFFALC